jgi:hypothetical protein
MVAGQTGADLERVKDLEKKLPKQTEILLKVALNTIAITIYSSVINICIYN